MISHVTAARFLLNAPQRSLLNRGISILGALAILSGGTVWAQSTEATLDPTAEGTTPPSAIDPSALNVAPSANNEVAPAAPERLPSVEAPLNLTPKSVPSTNASEPYIDSTNYGIGATDRSSDVAKRPQLPGVTTPLPVGQLGLPAADSFNYSLTAGRTTPSVKDYFYRTLRPPAILGNGNIRLIFPLAIPAPITSLFGWRIHPITGEQRFHSGTDLGAPMGTPVLAAYAGKVALADFLGGYGLAIALEHNKGAQQSLYGHLSEIFVKPGEWVKQGMVIGRVGSTGESTGPHLHFEFRQLTAEGWVAMDAGAQLEYALAQLVKSVDFAQAKPGELLGLGGNLGAVNVGVKGDLTLQGDLKQLSNEKTLRDQG